MIIFLQKIQLLILILETRKKSKKTRMTTKTEQTVALAPGDALVEFKTTEGDITVRLFGDTPQHRDNFLRLVREGYYNGTLFHRVMLQVA